MKTALLIVSFVLAVVMFAAMITTPTDEHCISEASGTPEALAPVTGYVYQVQSRVVYKQVYSKITGECVAVGIFGTVVKM